MAPSLAVGEGSPHLPLEAGGDEAVIGVLRRLADKGHRRGAGHQHPTADLDQGFLPVQLHGSFQDALPLAPVDGKNLVPHGPGHGDLEVVIEPVDAVLRLLGGGPGDQAALALPQLPQAFPQGCVVADPLGDEIRGPLQGLRHRLHPLFRVQVVRRSHLGGRAVPALSKQELGQRGQPLLPGYGGPGAPLFLVGAVEVLHFRQGRGPVDGLGQVLGELSPALNGTLDLLPALFQVSQGVEAFLQGPQGGVVHGPVGLFPVAGDEGDGVPLV